MSRVIECRVNDEYILGSGVPIGAAGSHDDVALRLIFNEMWDGLNIVATFKDALAESKTVIQLMPSMLEEGDSRTYLIWIPGGAKKYAGRVKLTLSGYSVYAVEENGTRIYKKDSLTNTATAFFRVLESDAAIVEDDVDGATCMEIVQDEINAFNVRMTGLEGKMDAWDAALDVAENGYYDEDENFVPGRVAAELQRQKAEEQRAKDFSNSQIERRNKFAAEQANRAENYNKSQRDRQDSFEASEAERKTTFEAAEAERNQIVGNLNKALDEIIALQKSYIGGEA